MDLHGKRVLITGANGFIGSHLVRRLAATEHVKVRGFVRTAPALPTDRVEYCLGDVTSRAAVEEALASCDVVIHTAALQSSRPMPTRKQFDAVNVQGTALLLESFSPKGAGLFVLLSTINVHGLPPQEPVTADSPRRQSGDRYSDSKLEGENVSWRIAHERGVPLTVIRPGCTYGPGATAWTVGPARRISRGVPVLIGDGRALCNAIYIDNLVDLILAAVMDDRAAGQAFIGTDGRGIPWREFFGYYARALGRPLRSIPLPLARLAGLASGLIERATGTPGPLTRQNTAFYTHHVVFDTDKNSRMLQHTPLISVEEGMTRTVEWLSAQEL